MVQKLLVISVLLGSTGLFADSGTVPTPMVVPALNCDDRVADGGFEFDVINLNERSAAVHIYEKQRAGKKLLETAELVLMDRSGITLTYRTRMGRRLLMTLIDERHKSEGAGDFFNAKFSFLANQAHVEVPVRGYLRCFVISSE